MEKGVLLFLSGERRRFFKFSFFQKFQKEEKGEGRKSIFSDRDCGVFFLAFQKNGGRADAVRLFQEGRRDLSGIIHRHSPLISLFHIYDAKVFS